MGHIQLVIDIEVVRRAGWIVGGCGGGEVESFLAHRNFIAGWRVVGSHPVVSSSAQRQSQRVTSDFCRTLKGSRSDQIDEIVPRGENRGVLGS